MKAPNPTEESVYASENTSIQTVLASSFPSPGQLSSLGLHIHGPASSAGEASAPTPAVFTLTVYIDTLFCNLLYLIALLGVCSPSVRTELSGSLSRGVAPLCA